MRNIFITDKQFESIIKKLSKQYKYYKITKNDLGFFCAWYDTEMTGFPFKIGIVDGCIGDKNLFPYVYFVNENGKIGKITVSYTPQYVGKNILTGNNDKILKNFVINNVETLYLRSQSFYKGQACLNFDKHLPEILTESPKLTPKTTGLKTALWVYNSKIKT